jgi:hypothetical protein
MKVVNFRIFFSTIHGYSEHSQLVPVTGVKSTTTADTYPTSGLRTITDADFSKTTIENIDLLAAY